MGNMPDIFKCESKAKTLHSLMTQQLQFARSGIHINTDALRVIKNICLDIVEMGEEVRKIQNERYGED